MPIPPAPARVKTNVLTLQEKTCSCGRWQEYKYPCSHAVVYFRRWEDMSFLDIIQQHVHDYYRNKSMQQRIWIQHFFQLYKIRSDMMEKQIHQHWGQGNLDDPEQNISGSIAISLILMNLQLSALSVERLDIIGGLAQMLWHDLSLSYCKCFLLFFILFLFLFSNMFDC